MKSHFEGHNNFGGTNFYVSTSGNDAWSGRLPEPNAGRTDGPFATIPKARDAVYDYKLSAKLCEPITVWIRGGHYVVSEPIVFTPEDSGPVTYAASPGEQVVIDGGKRLKGWRIEKVGSTKMWVTDVPEVAAGKWYFRQLFVNGTRRPRPRLPKKGFYRIEDVPGTDLSAEYFEGGADCFQSAPGDIQNWKNLTDVDVVVLHYWVEERMPIASFDKKTHIVRCSRKTTLAALEGGIERRYPRYYVENIFEALSEAGEWYLDHVTGKLYYIPLPGEDPETTDVFAPRTEQLLKLIGKPEEGKYVEFLRFKGFKFQHTAWYQLRKISSCEEVFPDDIPHSNWHQPNRGKQFDQSPLDFATAPQAAFNIPGIIYLRGARYCSIEDCKIEHIGWYGIELSDGCMSNRVVGNEVSDMGAGGIKLGGADTEEPLQLHTGNNKVTDNVIHTGGRVFHSAVGILSMHSFGNEISHNHVYDFFYSGISCGWVWGYTDNISKNNYIEKNYVHDIGCGLLSDMGGIYTAGIQPGTVIRGNLVHNIEAYSYGGWAIYLDDGSSNILVENNVCYNASSQNFNHHYGRENIVRNNTFAFGRKGQVCCTLPEEHISFTFEKNIMLTDGQLLFTSHSNRLEKCRFFSDLNLFWDISGKQLISGDGNRKGDEDTNRVSSRLFPMNEWRKLGHDCHSIIANPHCKDLKKFEFTLAKDSPAFALGFQPISVLDVGPRPKDKRDK